MEENRKIRYINKLSVEDYTQLRKSVGFQEIPLHQASAGLKNTAFQVAAVDGTRTVGMARILWDGGYTAYLADVIVHPDYQGNRIGSEMVGKILDYLRSHMERGDKILISLGAARDKEPFYRKLGFQTRPNEHQGSGMSQWLIKND
jgi:GNAT superfamily N-acetyltransferase